MTPTLKRKLGASEISVEWVDDKEWNAIESIFNAISSKPSLAWSDPPPSRPTTNLPMVPSGLPTSAATAHRFWIPQISNSSDKQREPSYYSCRTVNPNCGGVRSGSNVRLPCQFPSSKLSSGRRIRAQSTDQGPDFSPEDCAVSGEQTEVEVSRLSSPPEQDRPPGGSLQVLGRAGMVREESSAQESENVQPGDEDEGGLSESSKERKVRRLPAWMEGVVGGVSSFVGRVTAFATVEEVQLEKSQPRPLPWGLQPSTCVDEIIKPKYPAMQFRGQIVYSKTESEVNAATLELWQRVRELQETTRDAVPIGFDLEWKSSFERGGVPRKVTVLQLCLDGRRCDVMHIIYSGIPLSLQNLLEAPSTLKVGVGVFGDASKIHQDYQIATRKLADLRVVANQKMGNSKQWSLSGLALELTGKQVEKIRSIRCGDWEALPLSQPQLQYAATDAFASLHLYQVLASLPNPVIESSHNDSKI